MKFLQSISLVVLLGLLSSVVSAEQTENEKLIAIQKVNILDRSAIMIGMGLTTRHRDDFYIGSFYLDEAVQYEGSDEFLFMEVPRRMEFKIASDSKISARAFGRKLAESIRINNDRQKIKAESKNLGRLMRMLRGTYKKGDTLRFDYHKTFGTRVYLNGRSQGEIPNSEPLYKLLVNMWVGERPPTQNFKKGILGENEGDYAVELLRKYVSL